MFKDFTWSRFIGKVVVELFPKVCAILIAGYLLVAQPWKTESSLTPSAGPAPASVADEAGPKPAQRIGEAHSAHLELPATRPAPAPAMEEPESVPSPPEKPLRRVVKERQASAEAKVAAAPAAGAAAAPRRAAATLPPPAAGVSPAAAEPAKVENAGWSDKVLSLGDSAFQATKRGSARVIGVPVAAYEYSRDAVGKATAAVGSMLPFGR